MIHNQIFFNFSKFMIQFYLGISRFTAKHPCAFKEIMDVLLFVKWRPYFLSKQL